MEFRLFSALIFTSIFLLPGRLMAQSVAPVVVVQPELAPATERITLSGSFVAKRQAELSTQVAGLVTVANFEPGDVVSRGAALLELDDRLVTLQLSQADAEVMRAQVSLREARRLVAEAETLRADKLFPETELRSREAGVESAVAQLSLLEAARDTASVQRSLHTVKAPFSGVVTSRLAEVGEWVVPGTPVATLVTPDDLWLELQAPQSLWPQATRLGAINVRLDALPNLRFNAEIAAKVPSSDPNSRTFLMRLAVKDLVADVTSGMSAKAELTLESDEETLTVPRDALIRFPDGSTTVFVVTSGSPEIARQLSVEVSRVYGDTAVVQGDLNPSSRVVVRGNEVLTDGQRVRLVEKLTD